MRGRVRFDLYGTIYDQAYYDRCLKAIAELPPEVVVQWHGQLPNEQVPSAIAKAHFLYMPSVGENFGHTMLEALTAGRPLIISDRTPWKRTCRRSRRVGPCAGSGGFNTVLQEAVDGPTGV